VVDANSPFTGLMEEQLVSFSNEASGNKGLTFAACEKDES
jgi:hypothetical protein